MDDWAEKADDTIEWVERHPWLLRCIIAALAILFTGLAFAEEPPPRAYAVMFICPTGLHQGIAADDKDLLAMFFAAYTGDITSTQLMLYVKKTAPDSVGQAQEFIAHCLGQMPGTKS